MVSKLHYVTFLQVLYTLFDSFIVKLLKCLDALIGEIQDEKIDGGDIYAVSKWALKKLNRNNIKLNFFNEKNILAFLKHTTDKMKVRECYRDYINLGTFEAEYMLTMEDVKFYFSKNQFFFNPLELLDEYVKYHNNFK